MPTPQTGIFALGDIAHIYLEFVLLPGADATAFVQTVVDLDGPRSTLGGVNLVIGFRPELWRAVAPGDTPAELSGFNAPLPGSGDYTMPATQADLWLWIAGSAYDNAFDNARAIMTALAPFARLERELSGWGYRHSRDLTGFEDGTENPGLAVAPMIATVPDGEPGAGGSVLLFQKWRHRATEWEALPDAAQELVMGRTKADSVELDEAIMPPTSHVKRNTIEVDGAERKIFRRNTSYGNAAEFGTVFVGFSSDQWRLDRMLRRMSGAEDGLRDALTDYSTPLTGAYYFVPSLQALQLFAGEDA
jgi:putative iron-dependent peroxidase